jgi:hypothetical protein
MKTEDQTILFIKNRIHHIYQRPFMYGGSASEIDLLLSAYFELWAAIIGNLQEFKLIRESLLKDLNCGAANLSTKYRIDYPAASETDIVMFVLQQWKRIGKESGLSVPTSE